MTLGGGGALWADGASLLHRAAPALADGPRDSTGAGDAWVAGWLGARLHGAEPAAALVAANDLGARAVAASGARPPRPGDAVPVDHC